ncbi:MSHA biogenesis protein MshP [Vibrio sp. RE86]|uniref:MSHA biogenesis protein MshP n=1 Tax=Vibrio sp. RE86 TaxID=2607605 RepID=UPI00149371A5|nr:MSHA biogenesis protein MshP [Vibrio sp. RE86]NOH80940.1 MSHA biogenesis protein MshP [Vibrio sp. RE86]
MSRKSKQYGSMLLIVLFVILVLGYLATSLNLTSWSSRDSTNRGILGTQAWLLSHSANEYVLTVMYPTPTTDNVDAICTGTRLNLNGDIRTFIEDQIIESATANCQLMALECTDRGDLDSRTFYILESTVSCGTGINEVQRSQQVWLRD